MVLATGPRVERQMHKILGRLAAIGLGYWALTLATHLAFASNVRVLDFYVAWVATRVAFEGGSPYSRATTELIQTGLIGNLQPAGMDQMAFVSPYYHIFLTAPFGLLEYPLASRLWIGLAFACVAAGILLALKVLGWTPRLSELVPVTLACFFTFPAFASAVLGQTAALVFLFVVIVIWADRARSPFIAGIVLALGTTKPQLLALFLPAMLIWWIAGRQWKALAACLGTLAVLVGTSLVAFPQWPWEFLAALTRYPTYKDVRLGPEYLIDVSHPLGQAVAVALIVALVVWLIQAWRDAITSPDDGFTAAAALTMALTCVILPQTNIVNWIMCLPAILLILRDLPRCKPWQRALWLLACLAVLILPWVAYAAFWPDRCDLLTSLPPMAVLLAMAAWYKMLRPGQQSTSQPLQPAGHNHGPA
jgi:hypothetical protein